MHIYEKHQSKHEHNWIEKINHTPLQFILDIPMLIKQNWARRMISSKAILTSTTLGNLWDLPFSAIYIAIVTMMQPGIGLLLIIIIMIGMHTVQHYLSDQIKSQQHNIQIQQKKTELASEIINKHEFINRSIIHDFYTVWQPLVNRETSHHLSSQKMQADIQSLTLTLMSLLTVFIYSYGSYQVVIGHFSIALLIATNIIASKALAPLIRLPLIMNEVVEFKYQIDNKNLVDNLPKHSQTQAEKRLNGHVAINNISFSYPKKNKCITNFSAKFEPGTASIIMGASGSGKTTLARILIGQLDASSGRVTLDCYDRKDINAYQLQEHISYLGQEYIWIGQLLWDNFRPIADEPLFKKLVDILMLGELVGHIQSIQQENLSDTLAKLSKLDLKHLSILKALSKPKRIIILDEPYLYMNETQMKRFETVIQYFKGRKHTIVVMASHTASSQVFNSHYQLEKS